MVKQLGTKVDIIATSIGRKATITCDIISTVPTPLVEPKSFKHFNQTSSGILSD